MLAACSFDGRVGLVFFVFLFSSEKNYEIMRKIQVLCFSLSRKRSPPTTLLSTHTYCTVHTCTLLYKPLIKKEWHKNKNEKPGSRLESSDLQSGWEAEINHEKRCLTPLAHSWHTWDIGSTNHLLINWHYYQYFSCPKFYMRIQKFYHNYVEQRGKFCRIHDDHCGIAIVRFYTNEIDSYSKSTVWFVLVGWIVDAFETCCSLPLFLKWG